MVVINSSVSDSCVFLVNLLKLLVFNMLPYIFALALQAPKKGVKVVASKKKPVSVLSCSSNSMLLLLCHLSGG